MPDAEPMQNLSPLWFQAPSILALVSLITDKVGRYSFEAESIAHINAPLSDETLNNKFLSACQSRALTLLRCCIYD